MKIKVDYVSDHLTHYRAFRHIPVSQLVTRIQNINVSISHGRDNKVEADINLSGTPIHVVMRPKQTINGIMHVDIVTAWDKNN